MSKSKKKNRPLAIKGPAPKEMEEEFEALLAGQDLDVPFFRPGDEVTGWVVRVEKDTVYLDLGGKSEGVLALDDYVPQEQAPDVEPEPPKVGDRLTLYVVDTRHGTIRLASRIGRQRSNLDMLKEALESGIPVQGRVVDVNKGGYEIDLGGARGFCPHSQMDMRFVENPQIYVGQELEFRITDIREGGRNIIVSRRVILEEEAARRREETMQVLREGAVVTGKVTSIRSFGAFVDLGGLEGLVHVSEISHARVEDPADVLSPGQVVEVKVLAIEDGGKRISLSMKALEANPWDTVEQDVPVGKRIQGKVERLTSFGAFVSIAPGIDGLLHVSALGQGRRINHPKEVLTEGQTVDVVVTSVDPIRERISLELADMPGQEPDSGPPEVGDVITGRVEKVARFGVFVKIDPSRTGLVPRSETGLSPQADLRRRFEPGQEVEVKVIEVDEAAGRYTLSIAALSQDEERAAVDSYRRSSGGSGRGLGTLGDLLKAKLERDR